MYRTDKVARTGHSKDDFGQRFSWAPLAFRSGSPPPNLHSGWRQLLTHFDSGLADQACYCVGLRREPSYATRTVRSGSLNFTPRIP